jgi:hypothetical protein
MSKGRSENEKYWDMMNGKQLRDEYAAFLQSEHMESSPHSAHIFAIRKLSGSHQYLGLSEREIILQLAGELPYMYD